MTQVPLDPIAFWRDMLAKWEAGLSDLVSKNAAPPGIMAGLMGQYLTAMNMPSRTDLAVLDGRLQKIEHQLAHLAAQMERVLGEPRPRGKKKSVGSSNSALPGRDGGRAAVAAASAARPSRRTARKRTKPA